MTVIEQVQESMAQTYSYVAIATLGPFEHDKVIHWEAADGDGRIWMGPPGNVNAYRQNAESKGSATIEKGNLVVIKEMYCRLDPPLNT